MPRDDDDDPKETTKLVSDGAREMHRYDESHDSYTALVKLLKYKNYDHLVYLSVLIILICFPLGLAALLMALKAHEDAKKGYNVRAKNKARITYLIMGAAILVDILVVVIVVVVVKTT